MTDEQALQHPDLREEPGPEPSDEAPSLAARARAKAAEFLAPLPENAWAPPRQRPPADQLDPEATTTSDRSDRDAGSLYDPRETAVSTGSTDLASFRRGTAKIYSKLVGAIAGMLGGLANWRLADDEEDPSWLVTEDEARDFGAALGRIAARRATLPIAGEDETNDVVDGMQAGIVLIGYLGRNMMARSDRKRPQAAPVPGQDAA